MTTTGEAVATILRPAQAAELAHLCVAGMVQSYASGLTRERRLHRRLAVHVALVVLMWIESACHGEEVPLYVLVVAPQNVHASTYVARRSLRALVAGVSGFSAVVGAQ